MEKSDSKREIPGLISYDEYEKKAWITRELDLLYGTFRRTEELDTVTA